MNKGIFVIGTDTGVGKTVIVAGLALALKEKQIKVGVMKPIATGCFSHGSRLYSQDAIYIFEAASNEFPALTSPVRFKNPLAPKVASEMENTEVDLQKVFLAFQELQENYDFLIVEGIGGLLVPIKESYFVSDLVKKFKLPVIIVARAGLGTINHTLLTIEVAKKRGLSIRGIILNRMPVSGISVVEETNPKVIEDLSGIPVIGIVPELPDVEVESLKFGRLKEVFLEKVNLEYILK